MGFPGGSDGKESACNAGDLGSIPGLGRSREEGTATHSSTDDLIQTRILKFKSWKKIFVKTIVNNGLLRKTQGLEFKFHLLGLLTFCVAHDHTSSCDILNTCLPSFLD